MEKRVKIQLVLLLLSQRTTLTISSPAEVKFVSEEIPAGTNLNQDKILETKVNNDERGQVLLCSIHCKVSWACRGFVVSNGICKTFFELDIITDLGATDVTVYYVRVPRRVLLLRHDKINGGHFPLFSTHGSWYLNEDDPEAPKYSILGDIDKYRDKNGVYHFEMCYPKNPGMGPDSCFVFEQTSNPRRSSGVTENFILHHEPQGFANLCPGDPICRLNGLTADTQTHSWLDGNPGGNEKWCFAAGSSSHWPGGTTTFPGFCDQVNGAKSYFVELYTYELLE